MAGRRATFRLAILFVVRFLSVLALRTMVKSQLLLLLVMSLSTWCYLVIVCCYCYCLCRTHSLIHIRQAAPSPPPPPHSTHKLTYSYTRATSSAKLLVPMSSQNIRFLHHQTLNRFYRIFTVYANGFGFILVCVFLSLLLPSSGLLKQCWCGNNFTIAILVSWGCEIWFFVVSFRFPFSVSFFFSAGCFSPVCESLLHCHRNVYCKSTRSKCDSNKR